MANAIRACTCLSRKPSDGCQCTEPGTLYTRHLMYTSKFANIRLALCGFRWFLKDPANWRCRSNFYIATREVVYVVVEMFQPNLEQALSKSLISYY